MLRLTLLLGIAVVFAMPLSGAEPTVDYASQVKPILKARCYSCHGSLKHESGLRLDTGTLVRAGGENGSVVRIKNADKSPLVQRITETDEAVRMPPAGKPLTAQQIQLIKLWIDQGAQSPAAEKPEEDPRKHWAFQLPQRPAKPTIKNTDWARNPIDALIADRHEQRGIVPLTAAQRHILLRRVYLDLVGLPPTREQLNAFLADDSPEAYNKVVESLLNSKHHGERWGRHWMDVWRYSDWYGRRQVNDVRNSYPHIWRWRDWIINSLNDDKGYDQMVREMLAADELYPADDDRIAATGFIVRSWFSLNYDTWKQDLVEHTGKAFLGLRLNCAHCHDHKYDPITQEEYFKFRAFFEPLELRHDRVPGGDALAKYIRYTPSSGGSLKPIAAGLPRVYDSYPDEKTYMYRLGDTRDRLDHPPVVPGGPAIIGGDQLKIENVELPPAAWYPGLKSFVAKDEVDAREKAVASAQESLSKLRGIPRLSAEPLAKAKIELAVAKIRAKSTKVPPRSPKTLIAFWRFEGADDETGFLADSSGNGHTLHRITGTDPPAAPVVRIANPSHGKQAAQFKQQRSFAYLAAQGDSKFYANTFTLEAFVHFNVSQRNFNRTIADYDGCWTLLHRGIDANSFELRLRYTNEAGKIRDESTGQLTQPESPPLILQTAHDYYVCLSMGEKQVTLWASNLTTGAPIESYRFARDVSKLARPNEKTPLKIGNSDGTGRVDGWIDEVRYTRGELSVAQIAAVAGQSADDTVRRLAIKVAQIKGKQNAHTLAVTAAQAALASTQAELQAVRARLAADRARFEQPNEEPNEDATALAKQAALSERAARLATSRTNLVTAEKLLADLRIAAAPDAKKIAQAGKNFAAARKLNAGLEKDTSDPGVSYTQFGPQYPKTSTGRRRALANWIANRKNPLTARIAVNHIWARHFGRPLVESVFDFGRSGKQPTHPRILDLLAVELMENNWSMKHIHRLIVTSHTYQLSSRPGSSEHPNFAVDKDNAMWWKFDRRRLEAEIVRDSMLHVAGQLDPTLGGQDLDPKQEATSRRRSLYYTVYLEAGGMMQFMTLFDAPDPCDCYRRTQSIVPQQALAMSNSNLALTQVSKLTSSLAATIAGSESTTSIADFITAAFQQVLSRAPSSDEDQACRAFLKKQRLLYESKKTTDEVVSRARQSLVRVLLNHNDFITIH